MAKAPGEEEEWSGAGAMRASHGFVRSRFVVTGRRKVLKRCRAACRLVTRHEARLAGAIVAAAYAGSVSLHHLETPRGRHWHRVAGRRHAAAPGNVSALGLDEYFPASRFLAHLDATCQKQRSWIWRRRSAAACAEFPERGPSIGTRLESEQYVGIVRHAAVGLWHR
jgi:hypothetical protein